MPYPSRESKVRKAFIEELMAEALKNPNVWFLTADLGYSFIEPFQATFPDRFINMGVAEQNMVGVAAGLALTGKKVFIYSIVNFVTFRCLEQIRQDICYHELDVTLVSVGAGYAYADAGYSHHGVEDIAIMRILPHMRIFSPADPREVRLCMQELCRRPGPAYLRLNKTRESLYNETGEASSLQPICVQEGFDFLLLATGLALKQALETARQLPNYSIGVWSFPLLCPLELGDLEELLVKARGVISLEEHGEGGFATLLLEAFHRKKLQVVFEPFFYRKEPLKVAGSTEELAQKAGFSILKVVERLESMV